MPDFEIVVSAENNRYMQWQAMMFHYSCKQVLGRPPIVVVHVDDDPLLDGFKLIERDGGMLQPARTLRYRNDVEYPPRNTAAALQAVQTSAEFVLLCDADIVFLSPPVLNDLPLSDDTLSFDQVHYLDPADPKYAPEIAHACAAEGIDPTVLQNPKISGGVPHVIPTHLKAELSRQWLRYIELFPVLDHPRRPELPKYSYPKGPCLPWLSTMWAVIMAMHHLGLRPIETTWCLNNRSGDTKLSDAARSNHCMVHYCFDGVGFNKRTFKWDVPIDDPEFWSVPKADDTIDGFVRDQFLKTAEHFRLASATRPRDADG